MSTAAQTKTEQPKDGAVRFTPQPKQSLFLRSSADIAIFGGAAGGGKTWTLLYEPLYHTKDNPRFGAIVFRRTYPQIFEQGGLWDTSEEIYTYAGAKPSKGNAEWTFPNGSVVAFRHMENEVDRYNYQGAQIPLIGFDQLESFTEKQFFFMLSRNRSTCGVRPYVRATCNPEPGWLARFIQWWWDPETGYAIPERSGRVRWFVRVNDSIRWADSRDELVREYPKLTPTSVTFVASKLDDNQVLMSKDPGYEGKLMALPLVDRERLLQGNWKISASGNMFKREWFSQVVPAIPVDMRPEQMVRYWDLAATEPKADKKDDPDWSCGIKVGLHKGQWFIVHVARARVTPKNVEDLVRATAAVDGIQVRQRMEEEGGASGPSLISHYARNVLAGYDFKGEKPTKDKVIRAGPFSSAAENGNVVLVRGPWNQEFVDEVVQFPDGAHDDMVDPVSGAMGVLSAAWTVNSYKRVDPPKVDDMQVPRVRPTRNLLV